MKVCLDTNVLVSGFATRGLSADVVRYVMAEHELILAEVILVELRRVLLDTFGVPEHRVDEVEALLRRYPVEPKPMTLPEIEIRDPDDGWVLASALSASVDVLVTGDQDLLAIRAEVTGMQLLSPREFWELVRGV